VRVRDTRRAAAGVAVLGVLAVAVPAVAGCTSAQAGQASPTGSAGGSTAYQAPTNGAAEINLPPRPKDVPVSGVDPCGLLTSAQRTQFGVEAGLTGLPAQLANNSPTCNYRFADGTAGAEYNIAVDSAQGIALWLNPNLTDDIRQVSVGGFPGVDVTGKASLARGCTTAVSVDEGQMFMVQLGLPPQGMTPAQSCARTEQVASAALTTLQTLK
jgi:hypothetical protein